MYYGIEYAYGSNMANGWPDADEGGGNRADVVVRFKTHQELTAWVAAGNPYQGEGERAALRAHSRTVRRVLACPGYFEH